LDRERERKGEALTHSNAQVLVKIAEYGEQDIRTGCHILQKRDGRGQTNRFAFVMISKEERIIEVRAALELLWMTLPINLVARYRILSPYHPAFSSSTSVHRVTRSSAWRASDPFISFYREGRRQSYNDPFSTKAWWNSSNGNQKKKRAWNVARKPSLFNLAPVGNTNPSQASVRLWVSSLKVFFHARLYVCHRRVSSNLCSLL
jgi:hypothetical protein